MKRRKILQGIAALAMAERLTSLKTAWAAGNKPLSPGVQTVKGQATLNNEPARPGMLVRRGDTLRTGPDSELVYVIDADAYLQRSNSVVTLSGDGIKAGLRLVSGKLLSVFGKGDKQLDTPTATIGIRGTGCYLETEADRVYFCLCYGTADVALHRDPGHVETIRTTYHDHPVYLNANGETMMAPATVKNHSDAELILLESLVGRYPPFYGRSDYKY